MATDLQWSEMDKLQQDAVEYVSRPFEDRDDNIQAIDKLERELKELYPDADIFRGRVSREPHPERGPEHDVDIVIRVSNLDDKVPDIEWRFDSELISNNKTPSLSTYDDLVFASTKEDVFGVETETGRSGWKTKVKGPNRIPRIVGSTIFVHDENNTGKFLNAETGKKITEIKDIPSMHLCPRPAVQEEKIYIGDSEGKIYTVTHEGIELLCQVDTRVLYLDTASNSLVVLCRGEESGTNYGTKLYNINILSGDIIWEFDHQKLVSSFAMNDELIFLSNREEVFAISLEQGSKRWQMDIPSEIEERLSPSWQSFGNTRKSESDNTDQKSLSVRFTGPPIEQDGLICAPTDKGLLGIESESGVVSWAVDELDRVSTQPTIDSSRVFLPRDEKIHAVNTETGEVLWNFQTAVEVGGVTRIDGSLMFITDGDLISIDLE